MPWISEATFDALDQMLSGGLMLETRERRVSRMEIGSTERETSVSCGSDALFGRDRSCNDVSLSCARTEPDDNAVLH